MDTFYTDEKNTQILIGLLKEHGVRKVIASPGTTNIRFVASVQQDSYFEVYSAADERSAAYMACGLATESGEPIVLSCTGATASRNYMPGLTEAFYRKLPVLAVTSTQHMGRIGQNIAQVLDRSVQPNDIVKLSVQIPTCHTDEDIWACNVQINRAILELTRNGGGPVHINLETTYSSNFSIKELPNVYPIYRISYKNIVDKPNIPNGNVGIFVGNHREWSEKLTDVVDTFCKKYNAVVLCDHTSNYHGKYKVLFSLITSQDAYTANCNNFDLLIHIGDISGAYPAFRSKEEWRVNPDGEIRDTFQHLKFVFEMEEDYFFEQYMDKTNSVHNSNSSYLNEWRTVYSNIYNKIDDLPFSNIWIAKRIAPKIPQDSELHLGILNSLRSWNFFEIDESIRVNCNTGGFGIDGILSSAIGASLGCPAKNVYCIIGDLAFFYDMNSLGNHNVGNNLRILLINNGRGTEFRNYNHPGAQFGNDADEFVAAANHYGYMSKKLVKHYAQDLGFTYICAKNKNEFEENISKFLSTDLLDNSIIFEIFTNWKDESDALKIIRNTVVDEKIIVKAKVKNTVKNIVGEKGFETIRKLAGR